MGIARSICPPYFFFILHIRQCVTPCDKKQFNKYIHVNPFTKGSWCLNTVTRNNCTYPIVMTSLKNIFGIIFCNLPQQPMLWILIRTTFFEVIQTFVLTVKKKKRIISLTSPRLTRKFVTLERSSFLQCQPCSLLKNSDLTLCLSILAMTLIQPYRYTPSGFGCHFSE